MNSTRFHYHGSPVPDWQARQLPDHLVICDHDGTERGTLIVRRRTELYVPAQRRDAAA